MTNEIALGPHRLRWTERGAGPTVVLVHSSGMSSRQWRRLAEKLEGTHHVVSPDLLGYGISTPWPAGERAHYMHDLLALERLVDRLGPVHLVGHSYGGFLSLLLGLHRAPLVRSIAVYEPVSFGVLRSTDDREALATILPGESERPFPEGAEAMEAWLEGFIDYWNGPGGWQSFPEPFREGFRAVGPKVVGEVRSLGEERTPHDAYATLEVPTLLLGGETSTIAAKRVLCTLERVIPGAIRKEIPGAGHMGPLTAQTEVDALIADHLRRAVESPPP